MLKRWFLSKIFRDVQGQRIPVCTAYGGQWLCPRWPAVDDGWTLVRMLTSQHQIEAAQGDPRIVVCPVAFDPSPVPQQVADVYAALGVTAGMSMGQVLVTLAQTEPLFASEG